MQKCLTTGLGAVVLMACMVAVAASQRPGDREGKGPTRKGPPPKGFELGKLLPPHILDELELTAEQEKQLRELEKETRKKLQKIFTPEQQKQIERLGRRRLGPGPDDGPPPRGKGKRPPKDDDEDRPRKGKRPPPKDDEDTRPQAARPQKAAGGIAWFATWSDGLKEAKRTGKPILLISAAPHCAGVSGIW
jgi:Spy/CpxP family protein refolding chaperone